MQPSHFLQTEAWKHFQTALGRETFEASSKQWHWLAILEKGRFPRLYCPYGPTVSGPEQLVEAIAALQAQAKALGVHFIRIEPQLASADVTAGDLEKLISATKAVGATKASHSQQPEHTWHISLDGDERDIIANLSKTTRRYWNHDLTRDGISFRTSYNPADIELFLDSIHEVSERTGMKPHPDSYFRLQAKTLMPVKAACLLICEVHGAPAATIFAFDSPTTRSYAHAAAHYEFHKLQVSTLTTIYGLIEAQKLGLRAFDMYGIAPPDQPRHQWSGFTRFKQSFGGYAVTYSGTWDIPVKAHWYRAYQAATRASQLRRQIRKQLHHLRKSTS